jgi:hypothetical protein
MFIRFKHGTLNAGISGSHVSDSFGVRRTGGFARQGLVQNVFNDKMLRKTKQDPEQNNKSLIPRIY